MVIAVVGMIVFVIGIILIPLPGPGLVVCFAALVIWSLEFDWFKPHVDRGRKALDSIKNQKNKQS
jgi:uncharacterized protein (TIGR02611 family)